MQNQLGVFLNAWRPRLAFLHAGAQGPLPVFRLLVTRCIFQCFCVYLFQCFIIPKGRDARCMIIFVAPALSVPDCASWSGLPLWLDFYCGCSSSPGTNLSVHGFGPRLGAPWWINVGCAMRTFHGPLGIQQAVMCIACLQQPVPMKYAGVYDNICQRQLFVSSFWRPIRKLRCAHGTALKAIING